MTEDYVRTNRTVCPINKKTTTFSAKAHNTVTLITHAAVFSKSEQQPFWTMAPRGLQRSALNFINALHVSNVVVGQLIQSYSCLQ